MIHFELFSGKNDNFKSFTNLTDKTSKFGADTTRTLGYQRRNDLLDPLDILEEGYKNTFK